MKKAGLRLVIYAIAVYGAFTACRAGANPTLSQQFIDGHNDVSFSILVPYTEDEKRVENVKVTCDEGKCRVRVESISQRACGDGTTNEMIQINDYGRGGFGISDTGISGLEPGHFDRRNEVHEEAKT